MADENKSHSFWQSVPGMLTALAGIITAVAGLLLALYQTGVISGTNPPLGASTVPSAVTSTPSPRSPEVDTSSNIDRNEPRINISGWWHDTDGVKYEITQNGDRFVGVGTFGEFESRSTGGVNGRIFNSSYSTNRPSSGTCQGSVSANSNVITATCSDNVIGNYNVRLERDR